MIVIDHFYRSSQTNELIEDIFNEIKQTSCNNKSSTNKDKRGERWFDKASVQMEERERKNVHINCFLFRSQ